MSNIEPNIDKLKALFLAYLRQLISPIVDDYLEQLPQDMALRTVDENRLPCLHHIDDAVSTTDERARDLVDYLVEIKDQLRWGQTYTAADFGQHYVDNYGWMELFGTRGHLDSPEMSGGFLLLGPGLHYREHRHEAEEIYVVLSGDATWQRDGGEFVQHTVGTVIHHSSNTLHSTKARDLPMLALYLWRGGKLVQRPEFTFPN